MTYQHQFQLLKERRFSPYFGVQFLGALNDNVFKTSLLMLIAITFAKSFPQKANLLNNLGAAAFIFPFFLFAATAGQLADKYDKKSLIQKIKFAEVMIALLIAWGFYLGNFTYLLCMLFLLGIQAAFFSPVKYSILPQYLASNELLGGNALVESGTFVAILLGTILGGWLVSSEQWGTTLISVLVIIFALTGWMLSFFIPLSPIPPQNPHLKVNWEPFSQTFKTLRDAVKQPAVFYGMLGISWFWFYGSIILTQIPNYTTLYLGGTATVMTLLLIVASLGIGIGSLLCEWLCKRREEIGLVPFGALGLTVFAADLSFAHGSTPLNPIGINEFLQQWQNWHVLIDLFLIGIFGGFYSVPLYVLLQTRSLPTTRSQMIAANSILNALFMTSASILAIGLLKLGLTITQLFFVVSLINALVVLIIYRAMPEYITRFKIWSREFF